MPLTPLPNQQMITISSIKVYVHKYSDLQCEYCSYYEMQCNYIMSIIGKKHQLNPFRLWLMFVCRVIHGWGGGLGHRRQFITLPTGCLTSDLSSHTENPSGPDKNSQEGQLQRLPAEQTQRPPERASGSHCEFLFTSVNMMRNYNVCAFILNIRNAVIAGTLKYNPCQWVRFGRRSDR